MEPQPPLATDENLNLETSSIKEGDSDVISSSQCDILPQEPVLTTERKPTRQWAAWTRQEEESFFTALRQVGKNFEKITSRVQSKNKDQVRHYYYRLVRRMNKLLGQGLSIDAKNSKDTIAAMLRWWSLLEKYSCKASKLHLKPRRFKIFVETLEHQLLKDRKKNLKKRLSHVDNCSPTAASTVSNQSGASAQDTHTVKPDLVGGQKIEKLPGRGSLLKRCSNLNANRTNRSDPSVIKAARRRRKAVGYLSSATYKKWEKAATAGVSLVADAAEHLERTISDRETEPDQGLLGQKGSVAVGSILPPPPPPLQEANVERKMQKLKLQLFPIDGATQRALETNNHNPHLELTLSCRKKISSVLEHLNRKWGNSRTASGELTLFPYSVRRENLIGYQRWTQESVLTAADLHLMIGSPALFRLRYGWVSNCELGHVDAEPAPAFCCGNKPSSVAKCTTCGPSSSGFSDEVIEFSGVHRDNHGPGSSASDANILWQGREPEDRTIVKQLKELDNPKLSTSTPSAGEWADSLTNISMGDLLSETPHEMNADCVDAHVVRSSHALELPFTSDSFDAAIASHISRNLASTNFQSPNSTSILDAEETCDAFSFRDNPVLLHRRGPMERAGSHGLIELPEEESGMNHPSNDDAVDGGDGDRDVLARSPQADDGEPDALITFYHNEKDIGGLADIYWPDSLGPLDLDMPSSRYDDLILSDNQSGLNRLISGSLDAFQNCSYSGL